MRIEPLTLADAPTCLDLAATLFVDGSSLHRALGVDADSYRAALAPGFYSNVAQGLSVGAWDGPELLGAVIACDLLKQGPGPDMPQLAPLQSLLHEMEDDYLSEHPADPGEAVLIDMAFVRPDARGAGLYKRLRHAAHLQGSDAGFTRVIGLLSSAATQHFAAGTLGHLVRQRRRLDRFEHEGHRPFASVIEPKEIWLTEGVLPSRA